MQADFTGIMDCMRRVEAGETLVIGFFGGSITQGSLASSPEKCYANLVFNWWQKTFPQADLHYVNAGIGGTDSLYGVSRVVTDMLMYQPDFVMVDFSVNDEPDDFYKETYEGLIRRILSWPSHPAVMLLHNIYYDSGKTAEDQHGEIGDAYRLPRVSIRDTVYRRMKSGEMAIRDISPDGLHPNDRGHRLVADEVIRSLEMIHGKMRNQVKGCQSEQYHVSMGKTPEEPTKEEYGRGNECPDLHKQIVHPVTANAYERAQRLTIRNFPPELSGFIADPREKCGHLDAFRNGWIGRNSGDAVRFEVTASCIAVQYRRTVRLPARRAELILDGDDKRPFLLDGNFDETWGDCQAVASILHHGQRKKHTVEVRVMAEEDETKDFTPFYLMSLIVA